MTYSNNFVIEFITNLFSQHGRNVLHALLASYPSSEYNRPWFEDGITVNIYELTARLRLCEKKSVFAVFYRFYVQNFLGVFQDILGDVRIPLIGGLIRMV